MIAAAPGPMQRRYEKMQLILYQRDDCHLCDLALLELARAAAPDFESVFIDDDADLEQRYGVRVPVLLDVDTMRELAWPFDADMLRLWLVAGG
ncbi:glutaredoxin family protein [Lysobacter sp. A03]|uniref:glutaredoxin family protein n=1 Tax=Lysobacter sp. A03 TaxID=1199154 RepID=UPI0005B72118|nr:glutaredoxin family protein [Lysobacter sp. A03]KIQ97406.1 hypothetical protein TI01_1013 [Lysobacter sp. A03]